MKNTTKLVIFEGVNEEHLNVALIFTPPSSSMGGFLGIVDTSQMQRQKPILIASVPSDIFSLN